MLEITTLQLLYLPSPRSPGETQRVCRLEDQKQQFVVRGEGGSKSSEMPSTTPFSKRWPMGAVPSKLTGETPLGLTADAMGQQRASGYYLPFASPRAPCCTR